MNNPPRLKVISPYSFPAKCLVACIQFLGLFIRLFKGNAWSRPMPLFIDDSSRFKFKDILFFSWKYYCYLLIRDDNQDRSATDFAKVNFDFPQPDLKLINKATVHAGGDLMPYSWIQKQFCSNLWTDIGDDFFGADLVVANLETPIVQGKPVSFVPEVMLKEMHFNGDAEMFDLFNGKPGFRGFDFVSTANNHSMDMGVEGVFSTIDFLDKQGIRHTGIAKDKTQSDTPVYLDTNGIRFAFLSWTYSLNKCKVPHDQPWLVNHLEVNEEGIDLGPIKMQAQKAKLEEKADVIILCLHYGNAYQAYPGKHIRANTKRIFEEAGIDLILGGHPHNMQPMENFPFQCPWTRQEKTGWVIYSLGDFVAYDIYTLCHMPIWLQASWNLYEDENGNRVVSLNELSARPIYLMGNYQSASKRDLRMLDALRLEKSLENGIVPEYLPAKLIPEFKALMQYYRTYFNVPKS